MHHIRNPADEDFIYDPRTQPLEDPVLKARCELASLSSEKMQQADSLIYAFGNDDSNISEFGVGNCQDWIAGTVGMLERAGDVSSGEGGFWKSMINRSSEEMKNECLPPPRGGGRNGYMVQSRRMKGSQMQGLWIENGVQRSLLRSRFRIRCFGLNAITFGPQGGWRE